MAREHVIVKHLAAIKNLGSIDVFCSDKTGTLTVGEMRVEGSYDPGGAPSPRPLALARLNSRFETGIRSPLDVAVLAGAPANEQADWTKLDEIPFDFERRRLSVVVERDGERLLITKGAPDALCARCDGTEADRECWRTWIEEAGQKGLRLLAVALT
jgi:Mg2+-importing ATPase